MAKKTIRIRSFWYTDDDGNRRDARRGDEVDLSAGDVKRGEKIGAFGTPPDADASVAAASADFAARSDEDLEQWIRDEQPTVQEVVDATGGDPDLAERLLDAETAATGGEPRSTLVEALSKVIGRDE